MRVMVCGPIGGTGTSKISEMQKFLESKGFQTVKQFSKGSNYSNIQDFRQRTKLASKIIDHDLKCVDEADVLIILSKPSFGASIEMFVGRERGKKIILFSSSPVASPWPIGFSDAVVTNKQELVRKLHDLM